MLRHDQIGMLARACIACIAGSNFNLSINSSREPSGSPDMLAIAGAHGYDWAIADRVPASPHTHAIVKG